MAIGRAHLYLLLCLCCRRVVCHSGHSAYTSVQADYTSGGTLPSSDVHTAPPGDSTTGGPQRQAGRYITPGFARERDVLEKFYAATGGRQSSGIYAKAWTRRDRWDTTADHCGWYGISCDRHGRVIKIMLPKNMLYGHLTPWLGNLSSLHTMDLSNNNVIGQLPNELSGLLNLRNLWLNANQIAGTLPKFQQLVNLVTLSAEYNQILGVIPDEFRYLRSLQGLFLSHNLLQGTIPVTVGMLLLEHGCRLGMNRFSCPIDHAVATKCMQANTNACVSSVEL